MHLFQRVRDAERASGAAWSTVTIPEGGLRVFPGEGGAVALDERDGGRALATLLPFVENSVHRTALVSCANAGVRVNAYRPLAVCVLEDGDEILLADGEIVYFASRIPSEVRQFTEEDADVECPRCHLALRPGDAVVACEGCSVLLHEGALGQEDGELLCRSRDVKCPNCGHTKDELLWSPEGDDHA